MIYKNLDHVCTRCGKTGQDVTAVSNAKMFWGKRWVPCRLCDICLRLVDRSLLYARKPNKVKP
jgi:hypothetical protein